MGERYKGWLANADSAQILHGYRLHELTEGQQELLEEIYGMQDRPSQEYKLPRRVKELAKQLGVKTGVINRAVESITNLTFTAGTSGGEDPHVFEGDQHRRGLSRPQSRG
jgi:hypothetical protein